MGDPEQEVSLLQFLVTCLYEQLMLMLTKNYLEPFWGHGISLLHQTGLEMKANWAQGWQVPRPQALVPPGWLWQSMRLLWEKDSQLKGPNIYQLCPFRLWRAILSAGTNKGLVLVHTLQLSWVGRCALLTVQRAAGSCGRSGRAIPSVCLPLPAHWTQLVGGWDRPQGARRGSPIKCLEWGRGGTIWQRELKATHYLIK